MNHDMKALMKLIFAVLCVTVTVCTSCCTEYPAVTDLTVEYVETPLGIDTEMPRFGWQIAYTEDVRDVVQTAYRIEVTDEGGNMVWDTGKVESGDSQNIPYSGSALKPVTRYMWALTVWDNRGEKLRGNSWFETSLMSSDGKTGWNGAKWIGGGDEDLVLFSHYLPVFRLDLSFRLGENTTEKKIGFIYGANDERLMDRNRNIMHLANGRNESYVKIEFDLSPVFKGKEAMMNVYRVGYHEKDRDDVPFNSFPVPKSIIHKGNVTAEHVFSLYSDLGFTRFCYGKETLGECNLNPMGKGGDYIAFPVVGDIGYSITATDGFQEATIRICNFRSPGNVIAEVKMDKSQMKESGMYVADPSRNSMPMLRTVFHTEEKRIRKARLYVTARGVYEMFLNGSRIGDDCFNPGITQYNRTQLYQIYDVTKLLDNGQNVMGAVLGEGWWSGASTYTGENWNFFGDRQSLLAQLVITYEDGETQSVTTDPRTWKYFADGPVVYGSFFQGEIYDARKEKSVEGWNMALYDDRDWKKAVEVSLEGHVSKDSSLNVPRVDDYSGYRLKAQYGQTVKPVKELTAQSVEEVRPGIFVYDMGQNMVGVPRIILNDMEAGREINIRYAEMKYPDLPRYAGHVGMVMLENIRAAMAQDKYITKGGHETVSPRFTYHGYRYLEITGIDKALPLDDVKGVVLSSIDRLVSEYRTSNEKVNRLWDNIVWSTYANFFSIPTDCPQRNERLGWAGDISVFSRTSTYLADVSQFLRRYLCSMRDVQREDGRFPDVAPLGGGFGGLLWGSAGITVPWELYQQYGDRYLLAEHYDAMCRYIGYILEKNIDPVSQVLVQEKVWGNLGDWLGPEDQKNDKTLMWEAYFIYDLEIMSKVAAILGKVEDARKYEVLCRKRMDFFRKTYIDGKTAETVSSGADGPAKGEPVDIQTSYVLPLAFGIVEDDMKDRFAANLARAVKRANVADDGKTCPPYSLMTGFIGTAWISKALSDNGYDDVAYRLLQQTTYPSWLYPVEQGATTIWERLNSYTHVDGFGENNRMNSFNHYSFGAVGAWMYSHSLGIMRDEDSPGFKHFILCPRIDPTGQMTYARGYYESLYGRIESAWEVKDKQIEYSFTVPANTGATLLLPVVSTGKVTESGCPLREGVNGIKKIMFTGNGILEIELASGTYHFKVNK